MEFQKSVIELITTRTSTRSYAAKEIDKQTLQRLTNYLDQMNVETKGARFLLAGKAAAGNGTTEKLGTYGMISGATTYLIGIMEKDKNDEVEFGFVFEKIILLATDLGLQTCWLGGTFKRSDFEQKINLLDNEHMAIISPVGFKKEKPRIFETVVRAAVGANKRKPWNELFFEKNSSAPLHESRAGEYKVPLEMVRLAPSASNKQPWRIIKDENQYHFFLCRTKGYGVPNFDVQKNDMGIAECHFELSAREIGLHGKWEPQTISVPKGNVPMDWEYITTWVCGAE